MRFNRHSEETSCPAAVPNERHGDLACMRTAGHPGEHIAQMDLAAKADGVCHGCRAPISEAHRADCYVMAS
jgi:hypothetical protein